jgi:hypothetical protein
MNNNDTKEMNRKQKDKNPNSNAVVAEPLLYMLWVSNDILLLALGSQVWANRRRRKYDPVKGIKHETGIPALS